MNSSLASGHSLTKGESLVNKAGATFIFQEDGNLVLYVPRPGGNQVRWSAGTGGKGGVRCSMQADGNLVIYDVHNHALWASKTNKHPGASLVIQEDENVVIYPTKGKALWSTDSWVGVWKEVAFDLATYGLHFTNSFDNPKVLGFTLDGLCGGMSFTSLDYYHAKRPTPAVTVTPPTTNNKLGEYIKGRQVDSLVNVGAIPGGILGGILAVLTGPIAILDPMVDAGILDVATDNLKRFLALAGRSAKDQRAESTGAEWKALKNAIDKGQPVSIGLIAPGGLVDSHQVVAIGYRDGAREKWVRVYDSNDLPGSSSEINLAPDSDTWTDTNGAAWRAIFVESYTPKNPP